MTWISLCCLVFLSGALGTPPGTENFYSYRMDYEDDPEYGQNGLSGYDQQRKGQGRDYYEDDDDGESRYRGSDDWIGGNRHGWSTHSSSSFNRIPQRPLRPPQILHQKPITSGGGWDEEEQGQVPWSPPPPRRRKPSYVVKIRRPVKKDPAWIYFRPPNPGRVAPGWSSRPSQVPPPVLPPPIRRPPPTNKVVSSWEEDTTTGSNYPKDASYSFAYDAGDSERSEYADPWGTVRGSYSYIDPTGVRRTVHYTAGAATGFKILNSQPTNLIENVYRERDPVVVRRKPSAYVYHLHPDGGWKPWEGRKEVTKDKSRASLSAAGGAEEQPEEELALDETRYDPQPHRHRKPSDDSRSMRYDQSRGGGDEEERKIEVRGYEGGYGDRNPLVVIDENKQKISPGKMMALRMRRKKMDMDSPRQSPPSEHQQQQRQSKGPQNTRKSSSH